LPGLIAIRSADPRVTHTLNFIDADPLKNTNCPCLTSLMYLSTQRETALPRYSCRPGHAINRAKPGQVGNKLGTEFKRALPVNAVEVDSKNHDSHEKQWLGRDYSRFIPLKSLDPTRDERLRSPSPNDDTYHMPYLRTLCLLPGLTSCLALYAYDTIPVDCCADSGKAPVTVETFNYDEAELLRLKNEFAVDLHASRSDTKELCSIVHKWRLANSTAALKGRRVKEPLTDALHHKP
jgi:hypothetical protein